MHNRELPCNWNQLETMFMLHAKSVLGTWGQFFNIEFITCHMQKDGKRPASILIILLRE